MSELGRLTTVDAREVWKHEALGFTPWLRDHIDLLSEALGVDLEILASEAPVGDFKVDLLGKDLSSGRPVIIENQLEATNHTHLGQLITYAAGLDAGIVVWLTPQFRDEHRQALNWLNAHTGEGIDFFGVEIELLRINDSLPAPHFKLVAQPNEWTKAARTAATFEPSELDRRREVFLESVFLQARRERPDLMNRAARAGLHKWLLDFNAGRRGFSFGWSFTFGKRLRVYLYIDAGDIATNRALFDTLIIARSGIEAALGFRLEWDPPERTRRGLLVVYRPGGADDPTERLAELREWAVNTMLRMVEVLRPVIRELQPVALADNEDGGQDEMES